MTKGEVRRRVIEVRNASKTHPKLARMIEDLLYTDVLRATAEGLVQDPAGVARVALETRRIKFERFPG